MATRLTYTTGARSPELDRAFEAALAEAREREPEPLAHLVGGRDATAGEVFDREDPSRTEHVASRAREGAAIAADAVEAARAAQRDVEEAIDLIETYCCQGKSADGFETPLGQLSPGPYYVQQFAREQSRTIVGQ